MKWVAILLSLIMISGISAYLVPHYYKPFNGDNLSKLAHTNSLTSYTIDGVVVDISSANTATIFSNQMHLTVNYMLYTVSNVNFPEETLKSYYIRHINDTYQNTLAVISNYSDTQFFYGVCHAKGGFDLGSSLTSGSTTYISLNIFFGKALYFMSEGFTYLHSSSNIPECGNYLLGAHQFQYCLRYWDSSNNNGIISWEQVQGNKIVYEEVSVNQYGDSMTLLMGPYHVGPEETYTLPVLTFQGGQVYYPGGNEF